MSFATPSDDALEHAKAALDQARSTERAIRLLVSEGKAGSSALHTAQWRLQCALARMDQPGRMPSASEPEWDDAA